MGAFVQELFRVGLYKRSQGRIARQVTFAALAIIFCLAAYCLSEYYSAHQLVGGQSAESATATAGLTTNGDFVRTYVVPLIVLVGGVWASFRIVQLPSFADFLISVEAEMNKVSWPTRTELFRSSIVVMLMIFILASVLAMYDVVWTYVLYWIGLK